MIDMLGAICLWGAGGGVEGARVARVEGLGVKGVRGAGGEGESYD